MTKTEFMALCGDYLIDISVALENENLRNALKARNKTEIKRILSTEF